MDTSMRRRCGRRRSCIRIRAARTVHADRAHDLASMTKKLMFRRSTGACTELCVCRIDGALANMDTEPAARQSGG